MNEELKKEARGDCPNSKREDKKHGFVFDGDDPYVVCSWCGERCDAISGLVIGGENKSEHIHDKIRKEATLAERRVCYNKFYDAITKVLGESEEGKRVLELAGFKE